VVIAKWLFKPPPHAPVGQLLHRPEGGGESHAENRQTAAAKANRIPQHTAPVELEPTPEPQEASSKEHAAGPYLSVRRVGPFPARR
jgi:hypothetical protein